MPQTYGPAGGPTTRTGRLLFAVWAGLTLVTAGFILRFGHDAPWAVEWEFVPALVGDEPAIPWLWTQHNEHRLPLHRLVYLGLFHLTLDFRTGMLVQVAVLSGLAWGLMRVSATLRGRPAWADAFFPLALLHPGHAENWLMGYQLCFALSAAFACGIAVVAARTPPASIRTCGLIANVCLL